MFPGTGKTEGGEESKVERGWGSQQTRSELGSEQEGRTEMQGQDALSSAGLLT